LPLILNRNMNLFKKIALKIVQKFILGDSINFVSDIHELNRSRLIPIPYYGDFVRISSLELVAYEIQQYHLIGEVAEVGVFKGLFAKEINAAFPDRKLYLFDTFEGFDQRDMKIEIKNNYNVSGDFTNTSPEGVLEIMPHPENCIIKKGYFPETTEGVDEKFCFVSLDTDLYQPTYSGLEYFYPRLIPGGYIFVHDFTPTRYKGVRDAVLEFTHKYSLSYFPICDVGGTVVICKNFSE
jgi:O-methyltransferase